MRLGCRDIGHNAVEGGMYRREASQQICFITNISSIAPKINSGLRASKQKNPGRPPSVDSPAHLSEENFISHILPTPTKREPTRQYKV
ncbi:hypothetical protein TNCV_3395851 [Trichonephila clavipes]|nr:hypothetical protein TNCV_3395851 [Trichonephila clavipes]